MGVTSGAGQRMLIQMRIPTHSVTYQDWLLLDRPKWHRLLGRQWWEKPSTYMYINRPVEDVSWRPSSIYSLNLIVNRQDIQSAHWGTMELDSPRRNFINTKGANIGGQYGMAANRETQLMMWDEVSQWTWPYMRVPYGNVVQRTCAEITAVIVRRTYRTHYGSYRAPWR